MKPQPANAKHSCPNKIVASVTAEKVEGLLENVFGLRLPEAQEVTSTEAATLENEKFEGLLAHVFGVSMPCERTAQHTAELPRAVRSETNKTDL
jgi:hypothetical protein